MTDQEIKPRMVDGVGYCSVECPHHFVFYRAHFCKLIDYAHGDLENNVCPVWAQRMAAWAEEARSLLNLARIAIEQYGDKTGMLAANMRTLDDAYPGKDGE